MPTINPISVSKSPILQVAVKQCMIEFAISIQQNEVPVVSPNPGYKAYEKRMSLAKQVIQNPDMYVEMATRLVATIYPLVELVDNANLYLYLSSENTTRKNFMSLRVQFSGDPTSPNLEVGEIGFQLWDTLSGVNLSDIPEAKIGLK